MLNLEKFRRVVDGVVIWIQVLGRVVIGNALLPHIQFGLQVVDNVIV